MEGTTQRVDRRKEPRYKTLVEVGISTPSGSHKGLMKNISGSGMEIQMSKEINPNTKLTISLELDETYLFNGTVVWTLGDYINDGWIYRFGLLTGSILYKGKNIDDAQEKRSLVEQLLPAIRNSWESEKPISRNVAC